MTREDLSKLVEHFATVAISVSLVPECTVTVKVKIILDSIDTVADTVMFCTERTRFTTPSHN